LTQAKYHRAADLVRAQINSGKLIPGGPAPSGAGLARLTGYSTLTCRKALQTLIKEGVLVPGTSPNSRPRVPSRGNDQNALAQAHAARTLAKALAARRNAAKLTQPDLASITNLSVTSIGHAETGRLWQSRRFWIVMDEALKARGELTPASIMILWSDGAITSIPVERNTTP
jgi:DNA-binding GntR family transcriptional regulator